MSAHDGVELIDATIADMGNSRLFDGRPWTASEYKLELLAIREAITRDADWSDVTESNLRAQVQAARDDAAAVHITAEIAAALYDSVIADLERKLESARRIAVALEQELASGERRPPVDGSGLAVEDDRRCLPDPDRGTAAIGPRDLQQAEPDLADVVEIGRDGAPDLLVLDGVVGSVDLDLSGRFHGRTLSAHRAEEYPEFRARRDELRTSQPEGEGNGY